MTAARVPMLVSMTAACSAAVTYPGCSSHKRSSTEHKDSKTGQCKSAGLHTCWASCKLRMWYQLLAWVEPDLILAPYVNRGHTCNPSRVWGIESASDVSLVHANRECRLDAPPSSQMVCCRPAEWSDVANDYLRGIGIKPEDFKHKLYVVPPGDLCSWGGMGYVGCTKDCRVWISGDLWQVRTSGSWDADTCAAVVVEHV